MHGGILSRCWIYTSVPSRLVLLPGQLLCWCVMWMVDFILVFVQKGVGCFEVCTACYYYGVLGYSIPCSLVLVCRMVHCVNRKIYRNKVISYLEAK